MTTALFLASMIAIIHYVLLFNPLFSWIMFILQISLWIPIIAKQSRWKKITLRFHQGYYFMHTFVMTLTIKKIIHESLFDVYSRLQESEKKSLEPYLSQQATMTLENLKMYYPFPLYRLFYQLTLFYNIQGGDVITVFDGFLSQARTFEMRILQEQTLVQKHQQQGIILWLLNLVILVLSRFSLQYLYTVMVTSLLFQSLISLILLCIPLTWWLWSHQYQRHALHTYQR
jgi:hypothetical protein